MNIKLSNNEQLNAALNEVQKGCRVRTLLAQDIHYMCKFVFNNCAISKKAMEGVRFSADIFAQTFPNAYKGIPESTIVYAIYKRGEWWITDMRREHTRRPSVAYHVILADSAKEAIIKSKEYFG